MGAHDIHMYIFDVIYILWSLHFPNAIINKDYKETNTNMISLWNIMHLHIYFIYMYGYILAHV